MGDRVSVTLSVPTTLAEAAKAIMEEFDGGANGAYVFELCTNYEFEEVNYAVLDCEDELTKAGIAWMKTWGHGGGFNGGTAWAMFGEDGALHSADLHDAAPEEVLEPFFALLDKPEALVEQLACKKAKLTMPSWENQAEYGKRYLATLLINPPMTNPCADIKI